VRPNVLTNTQYDDGPRHTAAAHAHSHTHTHTHHNVCLQLIIVDCFYCSFLSERVSERARARTDRSMGNSDSKPTPNVRER
jgi:hypothetical protein